MSDTYELNENKSLVLAENGINEEALKTYLDNYLTTWKIENFGSGTYNSNVAGNISISSSNLFFDRSELTSTMGNLCLDNTSNLELPLTRIFIDSYFGAYDTTSADYNLYIRNPMGIIFLGCRNTSSSDNTSQILTVNNETTYKIRVWINQFIYNGNLGVWQTTIESGSSSEHTIHSEQSSRIALIMWLQDYK